MKAGFVQMTPIFGDCQANLNKAAELVEDNPADLLVLPEFFNSGYLFCSKSEVQEAAESLSHGPTVSFLKALSKNTDTILVAGLPEESYGRYYNSSVLVTPDGRIEHYRKTHLFDREKLFFEPGDTGLNVFNINGINIGMMICFDWFFPESARTLALNGAHIIAHPSNLVLPHCPKAMITRSLENKVFSITSNRSGSENRHGLELSYIGSSRVVSPMGDVLACADRERERVCIVDIEPLEADNKRINSNNDLFSDRRFDLYRV